MIDGWMDNSIPAYVETDFLSELGLEKGVDEQNSWDSEVNSFNPKKINTFSLHLVDPDCDCSTLLSQSSCEDPDAADRERRGSFIPHSKQTPSGREEMKQSESVCLI